MRRGEVPIEVSAHPKLKAQGAARSAPLSPNTRDLRKRRFMDLAVQFTWGNLALNLLPGAILWILQALIRRNMPAKPNDMFGYRTRRSKASQAAWDYANRRCVDLYALYAWPLLAAAIPCTLFWQGESSQVALFVAFTVLCIWPIVIIERELARDQHLKD